MKKFLRFFIYLKPCMPQLIGGVIFGAIFGACSGFGMPVIFKYVLKDIFEGQNAETPHTIWYIAGVAALLPILFLLRALSGYASGYLMTFCSLDVLKRLKYDLFTRIQSYPISFFDKFSSGDLLTRLTNDTASVQSIMLSLSAELFRQPLQVVGAVSFLTYLCYTKGEVVFIFIFLIAVPFCILPVQLIRKNLKRYAREAQIGLSNIAQTFNENLGAVHEVRVFGLEKKQTSKFDGFNELFKRLSLKVAKYELIQQPFMEVLGATLVAVTFVYAYYSKIDFPTFSAIGIALYFTIDPIKRIIRMTTDFVKTIPLFERIGEVLDYENPVPEPTNPVKIGRIRGDLDFKNVNFAYDDKIVLRDINIEIPAGTSCALVGESGAGKSTFAKLAMRLYDPTSGGIFMDGTNLHDISREDFVRNLGSVPQYPVLFNDTIYNNIALAKENATKEEVYAAAKAAYAHNFILELEHGYDTVVGERGDRISGGQKQRIALARVFLKDPAFIVLDEATSALDVESEAFIQQAIENLMKGRTLLIIAHRFSTIRNVKEIIVFKNGEIIDHGSHDELLARCPYFRQLCERQSERRM